jgi:hypothetical protein
MVVVTRLYESTWVGPLALAVWCLTASTGRGHEVLQAFIQQRASFSLGTNALDLVLDLTFFEEWSAKERGRMDTDADRRVTRREAQEYVARLKPTLLDGLRLLVNGDAVDLVLLYEPEVDLQGSADVGPAHHQLRLQLFAPPPAGLGSNTVFILESSLWTEAPTLLSVQATGRDGYQLKPLTERTSPANPARPGEPHRFKVRCLAAPKSGAPSTSASPSPDQAKSVGFAPPFRREHDATAEPK